MISGEGPGFDYTIKTNFIRVIASAPDRVENVVYILRTDSTAQENNETFTLELIHRAGTNIPTGDGVFFRNTVEVTIIDNDGKNHLYFAKFDLIKFNIQTFLRCANYLHGG